MQSNPTTNRAEEAAPFPWRGFLFILVFLAFCYFWALGNPPLFDPDEPVYAQTGKIMALSHSFAAWWTPHYNGVMWFDKPPITYWLIGVSMKLFGISAFAARFPCALAGLLLVFLTARLAWRLYPDSKGAPFWAALAIGTCVQTLILTRAAVTDMFIVASLIAALIGVWEWVRTDKWPPILWAGVAVGIGVLIKGPVAIVLIGGQLLIYLLWTKQWRRFLSAKVWLSLLLALAIAAPWYVSMVHLHGDYFVQKFLEAQNVTRYLSAEHKSTASPFFFIPILIAGFLPWTFALFPSIYTAIQRARQADRADLFALIWIALVFLFFSASQSKLVTYIFPLYPLAACVTGYWVAEKATTKPVVICRILWALIAIILIAVLTTQPATRMMITPTAISFLFLSGLMGFFVSNGSVIGRVFHKSVKDGLDPQLSFAAAAVFIAAFVAALAVNPYWKNPNPKSISAMNVGYAVASLTQPGDTVYSLNFDKPSLVYYSNRHFVFTDDQKVIASIITHAPYPLCVMKTDGLQQLVSKHLIGSYKILSQTGKVVVLIQCQPPARGGSKANLIEQ